MQDERPGSGRPAPTPGAKLRARLLLVGLAVLLLAYLAALLLRT